MSKSKFSLADVFIVLAALLFGFVCFLSTNFLTLGNTKQSIVLSVIITLLLGGLAYVAKLLKRTSGNFKTCFVLEIIILVLFTALTAYFTYSPFSHYFSVSAQKEKIQSKLTANITQAENMFAAYENYAEHRENLYRSNLERAVATKGVGPSVFKAFGFVKNSIPDSKQIENKMFIIHADLFPSNYSDTSNNNGIKEVATTWLSDAKNKVAGWKPIGIVGVVNEVQQRSSDWKNELVNLSLVHETGEQQPEAFLYNLSFGDVKAHFTSIGKPTTLSVGLAILAYLLMLLSYLTTDRSTKTTVGVTKTKGKFDIKY